MVLPTVFVGLVSHAKSTFAQSQGDLGLALQLTESFRAAGFESQHQVNTKNLFDIGAYPLTPAMCRSSVRQEIKIESNWFSFLLKRERVSHFFRISGRYVNYLLHWRQNSRATELRRLLNIEYSHVDLYRNAVASGAAWAIILEDDAIADHLHDLVEGLVGIFECSSPPKMVNISASYSLAEIGVEHLLVTTGDVLWAGSMTRNILESARPATNTVCAIAFRTDFLTKILEDFDAQSSEPVIPIDWKLNASLMRLWDQGVIGPGDCWFVDPGPVAQLSMIQNRAHK